jgi:hypothetical protein
MRGEIAGFLVRAGALVALWIGIVAVGTDSAEYRPWLLAACALYFALYFLVPLFSRGRPTCRKIKLLPCYLGVLVESGRKKQTI